MRRRWAVLGAALGLLVLGVGALLWRSLAATPAAAVEPPLAPAPRAWAVDPSVWPQLDAILDAVPTTCDPERLDEPDGQPWLACEPQLDALDRWLPGTGLDVPTAAPDGRVEDGPALLTAHTLGKAWLARGRAALAAGDVDAAGGDLGRVLQLGLTLEQGGSMMATMVAVAIQDAGLDVVFDATPAQQLAWAPTLAPILAADRDRPHPLPAGVVAECDAMEDLLANLEQRPGDPDGSVGLPRGVPWINSFLPLYSARKTFGWHRQNCRRQLEWLARPASERSEPPGIPHLTRGVGIRKWVDNPVGRVLMEIAAVDWGRFAQRVDLTQARRALLETLLALRRAEGAAGEGTAAPSWAPREVATMVPSALPATLAQLVPRWLPSLPPDPFDGEPLDWDRSTGRLASRMIDGSEPIAVIVQASPVDAAGGPPALQAPQ